jgi:hypothetical protein
VTLIISQLLVNSTCGAYTRIGCAVAMRVTAPLFNILADASRPARIRHSPRADLVWMFYAKAVNCCAEVVAILDSGPDGGNCASPADCRGFTGNCADIVDQFAELPVLPDFPNGMADYVCAAFPNDDNPGDSFIVGLSACPRCVRCFRSLH